jgi:hypothetical protein
MPNDRKFPAKDDPPMRRTVAVAWFVLGSIAGLVAAAGPAADQSVTTSWRPDPFANVAPKALDRQAIVEVDTPTRAPSALLGVYDVENDPLTVASFGQPQHGSATLNRDGTFTYRPQPGYVGDDAFTFTVSDGRGGSAKATMRVAVIRPSGQWATTSFTNLAEVEAGGQPISHGRAATVPRVVDWDGDGRLDLLVGAAGAVWFYRNVGTAVASRFAAGVRVQAGGRDLQLGAGRVAIAWTDVDQDGKKDLVAVADQDRKVRWYRNTAAGGGEPALAEAQTFPARGGGDFVADNVRVDIADWNGDGLPDAIIGAGSGNVKIAYNVGAAGAPLLDAPTTILDADGRTLSGSYNLNVRVADINQDGVPDFVVSYNWGNIDFLMNAGTSRRPQLAESGRYSVTGPDYAPLDLHQMTDGPLVDFADLNGDGTTDLVMGGEVGGRVRMAVGQSGASYLTEIEALVAAHPQDLGPYLADPAHAAAKGRLQALLGALYDYVTRFATPGQKNQIGRGLVRLIAKYPQYFKQQTFDLKQQPGMPALAAQVWLTLLMVHYHDPAARKALADAAEFTGGYRKLAEEVGLLYVENRQNPGGAEAIYQWVRTIPRGIYPGTCITAADWLGDRSLLVRGHTKNTFNGAPVDNGEYGFGSDARRVIGDRGSENWFMTVVHHEASHDVDAFVRKSPDLCRRWGQTLVLAGGPDMRADPATGWLSRDLTQDHFREAGLWNGDKSQWDAAWKKYWSAPPGSDWRQFGFMRGNIDWFYAAPQESLATQGNQHWNSTEGRLEVALDRWNRGYRSNLTEVLFFLDVWSLGLDKTKFYENDNACNQVISFARLGRNRKGHIERIDLGDRYYQFVVDDQGVATRIVHLPK